MAFSEILASIDREIALLKQARALLNDGSTAATPRKKAGRPKKTTGKAATTVTAKTAKKAGRRKKRNLSPEGRKRIAEAVRRRWEKQRKAAAK